MVYGCAASIGGADAHRVHVHITLKEEDEAGPEAHIGSETRAQGKLGPKAEESPEPLTEPLRSVRDTPAAPLLRRGAAAPRRRRWAAAALRRRCRGGRGGRGGRSSNGPPCARVAMQEIATSADGVGIHTYTNTWGSEDAL